MRRTAGRQWVGSENAQQMNLDLVLIRFVRGVVLQAEDVPERLIDGSEVGGTADHGDHDIRSCVVLRRRDDADGPALRARQVRVQERAEVVSPRSNGYRRATSGSSS